VKNGHARSKSKVGRALDLIDFIDKSPTPYHAVLETVRRLESKGYQPLDEGEQWRFKAGDRRYVTRGGSTIVAFHIGKAAPARAGFKMIGAHTDSPNLKLKPKADLSRHGYRELGVEVYGGVLYSTWLDRDLSLAGRVAVKERKGVTLRTVDLKRPILRIPNLAIHLNREVNKDGLKLNPQTHLVPVLGLAGPKKDDAAGDLLAQILADELNVPKSAILDHDLSLYDTQKGAIAGLEDEFIHTARLDNLGSCHAAVEALLETSPSAGSATRLIALYDHEEVGSKSAQGAAGPLLESVLARIVEAHEKSEPQGYARAIAASFHISADMAHAVHPNYADRHEPSHMPVIGRGPVVKANAGQSYATDGESAAYFVALCKDAGFEPQNFVVRSDLACGSTIGPITATRIGVRTVDVGNPMLSMHSVREMAGTADVELMLRALVQHLKGA
jgi:aspartyl aminopeptidase